LSAAEVFRSYLDRFTAGDLEGASALLSEDFEFQGPMLQVRGRDAFLDGASGLLPIVRGNRMLRQWEDGEEVCSVYEFNVETGAGSGAIPMSEWARVRDGKLVSARLFFDTAQMAALMPAS